MLTDNATQLQYDQCVLGFADLMPRATTLNIYTCQRLSFSVMSELTGQALCECQNRFTC